MNMWTLTLRTERKDKPVKVSIHRFDDFATFQKAHSSAYSNGAVKLVEVS